MLVFPRLSLLTAMVWMAYPVAAVADVAGQFQFVAGDVRVVAADGSERPAQKGQSVAEGESVVTSASGSAQIKMGDGGTIAVRPGSRMKFDIFRFNGKQDGGEKATFSLLSGGLRAITGLIGKVNRQNYSIETPTATIGIRGTDHEPSVVLTASNGVEQRNPPGTYDRVNVGATALANSSGTTLINPNQVGFAGITDSPFVLPTIPNLYQATPVPAKQSRDPASDKKADPATSSTSDGGDKGVVTTSARSGSANGEDVRVVPAADAAALGAPVASTGSAVTPVTTPGLANAATTPSAPVAGPVLTGTDDGGRLIDVNAQTIRSSSGLITTIAAAATTGPVIPPVTVVEPVRTFSAPLHYSLGFDGLISSTDAASLLGTSLSSTQTSLSAANSNYQSAVSATNALVSANTSAASALASAKAAYALALSAANVGDPTLALILNALNSIQSTVINAASAYDGGTAAPGTGLKQTLNLVNQTVLAGNRLVAADQTAISSASVITLQSASYGAQAAGYAAGSLTTQINNPAFSGQTAANTASASYIQNGPLANQAVSAATALTATTPGYLQLQAAANALNAAVTASSAAAMSAPTAIRSAQAAASIASPVSSLSAQTSYLDNLYRYAQSFQNTSSGLSFTRDAIGSLSSVADGYAYGYYGGNLSITPSPSTLFTGYGSDASSGLSWGRWQGGQVTVGYQYYSVNASGVAGLGSFVNGVFVIGASYSNTRELGGSSLHWITGTANFPSYLPKILTGTANYSLVGGTTPTDSSGNVGALTNASLSVNFTTQRANASVGFSLSSNAWTLTATDLLLRDGGLITRGYCGINCYSVVNVTKNGSVQPSAYGDIQGSLLGSGLSSAALQYSVTETTTSPGVLDPITLQTFQTTQRNIIEGVAGLVGPRQNEATPYRLVATTGGSNPYYGYYYGYYGNLDGGEMPSSQLVDNASGLQAFASGNVSYLTSVTPTPIYGYADRAIAKIGTAINRDVGSTVIDGLTIAWGRWEGGNIDIYSRDGSTKLGTVNNASTSIHWLTSSPLAGQLNTIPLTGVATYTLAGATSPTDMRGNVGTLGAVTLQADFTNQKVDASVKVSFVNPNNTAAFSIDSKGMPITNGGAFRSDSLNRLNAAQTTVSCAGASCGTSTNGQIDGKFIGAAAKGAGMSYGFTTSTPGTSTVPAVSNSVNGVVVLKR